MMRPAMDSGGHNEELSETLSVRATDGEIQSWSLRAAFRADGDWLVRLTDTGNGAWEAEDVDVFWAFSAVRTEAEARGFRFLVVGARPEYWPTAMSSQMGGGLQVQARYQSGVRNILRALVASVSRRHGYRYVFAPARASKVCTAAEQAAYRERWLAWCRPR